MFILQNILKKKLIRQTKLLSLSLDLLFLWSPDNQSQSLVWFLRHEGSSLNNRPITVKWSCLASDWMWCCIDLCSFLRSAVTSTVCSELADVYLGCKSGVQNKKRIVRKLHLQIDRFSVAVSVAFWVFETSEVRFNRLFLETMTCFLFHNLKTFMHVPIVPTHTGSWPHLYLFFHHQHDKLWTFRPVAL